VTRNLTDRQLALESRPVRLTPLRNHRPLFVARRRFLPAPEQLGACVWLVVFNVALYGALIFSILTRHHG
jgi:hypothetical protein